MGLRVHTLKILNNWQEIMFQYLSQRASFVHVGSHISVYLGGYHFLWNRGSWNSEKYLSNIFVTPLFEKKKYDPPPWTYNVEETCYPNARSMENMHFGDISLNKTFSKVCGHPIISWLFLWPHYFSWKIFMTPTFFMTPHSKENDSPLSIYY